MKRTSMLKTIGIPAVSLFVICLVVAAALAVSNWVTADRIQQLTEESTRQTMKQVLPADSYEPANEDVTVYRAVKDGETAGWVILTSAKGYGGDVDVMTGFLPDGSIARVEVIACDDETPGLGQRTQERAHLDQYTGKTEKTVLKKDVDAITGASISSAAVNDAVNSARDRLEQVRGGN